jgi:outer membrane lipopolysaccharide assembly protein LptE/RlpB
VIGGVLRTLIIAAALASASCGYTLAGRGSFLPDTVKIIGIPDFTNRTPYYEVGQTLSQRVRTEFIGRGRYKVLPQGTGVDAILRAEINSITLAPTAFNSSQQATRYAITVSLGIQLIQASDNKVLWQNQNQVFREEYQLASGGGVLDAATFFGQASNAIDRMATDFARSVVSAILEAF